MVARCQDDTCKEKCATCNGLCHHLYKCDPLCYDYMNGNICKHLHRIHSLQCVSKTEESATESMDISFDNDDTTAATDYEEGETKEDPYCLPSKPSNTTSKK